MQEHITAGGPLSSLTGQKLMDMINARLPPGVPAAKLSTTREYLSKLKGSLGAEPSERELRRHFAVNPAQFAVPFAVGAGALPGLLGDGTSP